MATDPWGFHIERQAEARRYRRARRVLLAGRVGSFLAVAAWLLSGPTAVLRDAFGGVGGDPVVVVAGYVVALYVLLWAVGLPFGVVGTLVVDTRFGLSTLRARGWLADEGKATVLGLAFALVASEVLYALLRWSTTWWWLAAWALGLAFQLVVGFVGPVLVAPLFFRFRPLRDPDLAARLRALADAQDVPVVGVYEMEASAKGRRANAALAGFGRTRRIIVTDTLLRDFAADEIETVLAHELAHHRNRDSWRGLVPAAATAFVGLMVLGAAFPRAAAVLGFPGMADVAALPLLLLLGAAISVPFAPLENALSRRREDRADAFAIEATGKPDAFASAMAKLHDRNLAVADPHPLVERLLYSHPSGRRRVERARAAIPSKRS